MKILRLAVVVGLLVMVAAQVRATVYPALDLTLAGSYPRLESEVGPNQFWGFGTPDLAEYGLGACHATVHVTRSQGADPTLRITIVDATATCDYDPESQVGSDWAFSAYATYCSAGADASGIYPTVENLWQEEYWGEVWGTRLETGELGLLDIPYDCPSGLWSDWVPQGYALTNTYPVTVHLDMWNSSTGDQVKFMTPIWAGVG